MRPRRIRFKHLNPPIIRSPVLKRRKHKSADRHPRLIISAHRAHRTDQEPVNFLRFPEAFLILCLSRNIIIPVKEIDRIIPRRRIFFPKHFIKNIKQCIVFQLTLPQCAEQLPHTPGLFLLPRKDIFLQRHIRLRKRDRLRDIKILLLIWQGELTEILIKCPVYKPVPIQISPCNPVKSVSLQCHSSRKLQHILTVDLIHCLFLVADCIVCMKVL